MMKFIKSLFKNINSSNKFITKQDNPSLGQQFDYILNDPAANESKKNITIPSLPSPCPMFTVSGHSHDTKTMQVYSTLAFTLGFIQNNLTHPLNRWSSTNNLQVFPKAGTQFNAYYDRSALKFFYDKDKNKNTIFTCDSPDIVAHELGHAVLDAVRPDLWNVQSLETTAFHEAFGDTIAILSTLQHEQVIKDVLAETNNDISRSNIASKLAEQMGTSINSLTGGRSGMADALRNAVNQFMYIEPEKLPYNSKSDSILCGECHSFSRVFTGAWYAALVNMYNFEKSRGMDSYTALVNARDHMAFIYMKAIPLAQLSNRFYLAMANSMLISARNHSPEHEKSIRDAFVSRNILGSNLTAMSNKTIDDIDVKNSDVVWKMNHGTVVRGCNPTTISLNLNNYLDNLSMQSDKLSDITVDIAYESYNEFDQNGLMIQSLDSGIESAKDSAAFLVRKLIENNEIEFVDNIDFSKSHTKTHAVANGKLHRLYFN